MGKMPMPREEKDDGRRGLLRDARLSFVIEL
jgi:hypothetical protein